MKATTETALVRACLQYLNHVRRIPAWRMNTGAVRVGGRFLRFGTTGMSDILGILPGGRWLAVEAKSPRGRPTAAQAAFLELIRSAGGVAGIVRSIDDLETLLNEAERGNQ